ncbi:MAG: 1-acyl-sn-glycerol-3-phosphate acyltransferase [Polyangiaceae bacterium]|nr:1-acyl-sn-glycerol-3-phosphate acyltransferase [Polyangiaceae bacterium]
MTEGLKTWARAGSSLGLGFGAALALRPFSRRRSHDLEIATCRRVLRDANITLRVDDRTGLAPDDARPRLYVHLDQQTLLAIAIYPLIFQRQFALIANIEFALLPIIGWLTVADGAVIIVRQWPAQARAGMRRAAQRIRDGESFGVSIEGRRSADGELSPYKKGPVVLAIEAQCDIIPFMTHGEWGLWPRGQWFVRPGTIEAVLYPPISTRGLAPADRHDLVGRLRDLAVSERALRGRAST